MKQADRPRLGLSSIRGLAALTVAVASAEPSAGQVSFPCPSPSARLSYGIAYDASRDVTVLYGGSPSCSNCVLSETWEWNGYRWSEQLPSNNPGPRRNVGMAYDSAREVTVLFGGSMSDSALAPNGTWEWDGIDWQQRASTGPASREDHVMAYDSARGVTVMFGGLVGSSYNTTETWEWNGTSWSQQLPATSPPPRVAGRLAYDSYRGVSVMFGGAYPPGMVARNDTWEWDGSNWTERFPANVPIGRAGHGLAFDSNRGVSVLVGGSIYTTPLPLADTWEWDGMDWTQIAVAGPSRNGINCAFDSLRGKILFFGGHDGAKARNGTWEFNIAGSNWERIICHARRR